MSAHAPAAARISPAPSNSLGVAGFVVSLTGLIATCGALSPIGLLLSFFALFRRPRGFALAGFVLGLIGSIWAIFAVLLGLVAAGGAAVGIHAAQRHMEYADDHRAISGAITAYQADTGFVPASLLDLSGLKDEQIKDEWGNFYNYAVGPDGQSFTLRSDGPDAAPDTDDDFELPQGPMFDHIGPDNFEQVIESLKRHGDGHRGEGSHGGQHIAPGHHDAGTPQPARPAKRNSTPI